jgi:hypothetical protein
MRFAVVVLALSVAVSSTFAALLTRQSLPSMPYFFLCRLTTVSHSYQIVLFHA